MLPFNLGRHTFEFLHPGFTRRRSAEGERPFVLQFNGDGERRDSCLGDTKFYHDKSRTAVIQAQQLPGPPQARRITPVQICLWLVRSRAGFAQDAQLEQFRSDFTGSRLTDAGGLSQICSRSTAQAQDTSPAGQLSRLADLRQRGVLSAEEFEREKAKVLSSP